MKPVIYHNSEIPKNIDTILNRNLVALMIFPFIFLDNENIKKQDLNLKHILNKQKIYFEQCKESFIIGFYMLMFFEFIVNMFKYKDGTKAYNNIRYVREVNENCDELNYICQRRAFAWNEFTLFPDLTEENE